MADSLQHADPAGTIPAGPVAPAQRGGAVGAGWLRFRAWRRSRPFWGGIFLIVAGAELLLIPLPMDSMGLILHIGIGGVAGILIGAVLIVAGLLLWFHPVQHIFYSIVAVLLAIGALVASNLGGFLIGTILGMVGGSLGFAWTPLPPGAQPRRLRRRTPATPADIATGLLPPADGEDGPDPDGAAETGAAGLGETADEAGEAPPASVSVDTMAESQRGRLDPSWGADGSVGGTLAARHAARYAEAGPRISARHRRLVRSYRSGPDRGTRFGASIWATLMCLLTFGLVCATPSPSPTTNPLAAAAATPTPTASPAASASPSPSAAPKQPASLIPASSPAATASPSPSPPPVGSVPLFAIATVQSTLTASSATLGGFKYDGVVTVPTADGTEQMMQFSATSLDLSGVNLAVSQGGSTITTTASSLDFSGNVVLYATQLSGDLLGIPITLTPGNVLSTLLQLLGPLTQGLTQVIPLTMTNVTTLQPFTSANNMTASSLQIS